MALAARVGPAARELESVRVEARGPGLTVGGELATTLHRRFASFGWRPSVGLDVWSRRWDVAGGAKWSREVGVRVEPRLAARFVLTPYRLYSRWWTMALTLDVGVGAAMALFVDRSGGYGALSPTVSVRPAAHLGRYSPGFVALDLRVGAPTRPQDCTGGRAHCSQALLNPAGTSLGLVVGQTF